MGVNLTGANLSLADLRRAFLTGATGMETADLTGVLWFCTYCPDGTYSRDNPSETCDGHLTPN